MATGEDNSVCTYVSPSRPRGKVYLYLEEAAGRRQRHHCLEELVSQDQSKLHQDPRDQIHPAEQWGGFYRGARCCSELKGGHRKSNIWTLRAPTRAAPGLEAGLSPRALQQWHPHIALCSQWTGGGEEKTDRGHGEDLEGLPEFVGGNVLIVL